MFIYFLELVILIFAGTLGLWGEEAVKMNWYKGNLHAHTLWSDGDEFMEMAAEWYKSHGYQFISFTDHNVLQHGDHWVRAPIAKTLEACREKFGEEWIQQRYSSGGNIMVKLHTLEEVRKRVQKSGEFILLEGLELSANYNVHINVIFPPDKLELEGALDAHGMLLSCIRTIEKESIGRDPKPLMIINHPNWNWALNAEDLAADQDVLFFEVCNNCVDSENAGDEKHVSTERMWDIANTLRLLNNIPPLYGLASDDAHNYHSKEVLEPLPGTGWIMVRAKELSPDAILRSLNQGDFYSSTGVILEDVKFDKNTHKLYVKVKVEPNIKYKIAFIGTMDNIKLDQITSSDKAKYLESVGKVLFQTDKTEAAYQLTGKELYVRAVVTADRLSWQYKRKICWQQAWTQPIGWKINPK